MMALGLPFLGLSRLWLSSLLVMVSSTAFAQQSLIVADDGTRGLSFRNQTGRIVTFVCPSTLNLNQGIWGTDVYLDESAVCKAAVHAGVLARGTTGQVTIVMGGPAESFQGTERNGVTSASSGPWSSTYSFVPNTQAGQIDWYTTYDRVPDDFHTPITVLCPPKGNADTSAWGTDVYSASSPICVAAVHAGLITLDAGGRVTVTLQPKQETFVASVRNGITTRSWTGWNYGAYPQPYKVTPGAAIVTAPGSADSRARTIRLSGFTASGTAVPVVPRTIQLNGFTAAGTATPVAPRTITMPGWTATGGPP